MARGPIRRKSEKAIRDRGGVPVLLFYDEANDKTIMARATDDGKMYTVVGVLDGDGNIVSPSAEKQNNQNKLFVNSDNVEGKLDQLLTQLKIMNYHLSNMTDMQIDKHDIGEF
jgi:hypothetical protein